MSVHCHPDGLLPALGSTGRRTLLSWGTFDGAETERKTGGSRGSHQDVEGWTSACSSWVAGGHRRRADRVRIILLSRRSLDLAGAHVLEYPGTCTYIQGVRVQTHPRLYANRRRESRSEKPGIIRALNVRIRENTPSGMQNVFNFNGSTTRTIHVLRSGFLLRRTLTSQVESKQMQKKKNIDLYRFFFFFLEIVHIHYYYYENDTHLLQVCGTCDGYRYLRF